MSHTIPTSHVAGDTFAATLDGSEYPASSGWTAQLVLIGPARITVSATASGADHAISVNSSTTGGWAAGSYSVKATFTKAGERYSQDVGTLEVTPDPANAATTARSLLTAAEQALQDLEASYRTWLASGRVHVAEYTIAGRKMVFRQAADFLTAIAAARRDVASERAAKRVAAGLNPRMTYVTRM